MSDLAVGMHKVVTDPVTRTLRILGEWTGDEPLASFLDNQTESDG